VTRITTPAELLAALNNLISSIDAPDADMRSCQQTLIDAACDLEGPVFYPPEILGVDKLGEYDGYTQRQVR
jgi:hypothetical protein